MITYTQIAMLDARAKKQLVEMMRRHKIGAKGMPESEDVALTKWDIILLLKEMRPPFEIKENLPGEALWRQLKGLLEGNI